MNASLEKEILIALEQAGIRLRAFTPISKLHSPQYGRIAYRIDHDWGSVKVRCLEDEPTARQLAIFAGNLPDAFAPILLQHGRVMIEDWIEGNELPQPPKPDHLEIAGALLGELHAQSTLQHCARHEMRATEHQHLAAQKSLDILAAAGFLKEEEAAKLERALRRLNPIEAAYGLVHLDFCGENMIIDRAGKIRVVDNERMRLDLFGYDLGRTWYRWALPMPEWNLFCETYASRLPFPSPLDSLPFWKIVAAARAAELRLRVYPEGIDVPLRCLQVLAAEESV